jgi:polyisoprenoid-binding protein YceI
MKKVLILFIGAALLIGQAGVAQKYEAVTESSILRWSGKTPVKGHDGRLSLKEGSFEVKDDQFVSGVFVIDMNSIIVDDLKDANSNARLLGHLKSDDFFSVETYPTATLTLRESTAFNDGEATVKADLAIKGKTHPVTFIVKRAGDVFQSRVTFDRSLYDVRFGSGKFFQNLGNNAIDDMLPVDVTIVGKRK